ncbi:MAG: NAD(P)H-hydrate dehydratase [Pseudomonadota bacterium]
MTNRIRPLSYDAFKHLMSARDQETHKGDFGHVFVVGGDQGYGGAALMAAEAAARTGAGLTSVATHPAHATHFLSHRPELMVRGVITAADMKLHAARATVMVLGPGLGRSEWSKMVMTTALEIAAEQHLPIILDADALNWISEDENLLGPDVSLKRILTPHPGEAARLLGITTGEVNANRQHAVRELQHKFGGVAVLKGAGTLVCYVHEGRQQVETCVHGNPGMASGGMGDVLSGVLAGLVAQHYSLAVSARIGVCIHSKAADLAAQAGGQRGLLASDLFPHIRRLVNP